MSASTSISKSPSDRCPVSKDVSDCLFDDSFPQEGDTEGCCCTKMSKFSRPDRSHFFPYRRGETYPTHMTMNFRKLNVDACRKYLRHYHINTRPDCSVDEFRVAMARHFDHTLEVDESETIRNFCKRLTRKEEEKPKPRSTRRPPKRPARKPKLQHESGGDEPTTKKRRRVDRLGKSGSVKIINSEEEEKESDEVYCICGGRSYGKMIACENPDCRMKWFHFACVNLTPSTKPTGKWYCPECAKGRSRRGSKTGPSEQKTYKNLIEQALRKLAKKKKGRAEGTFREICAMIEKHHWKYLNWKSESDIRKTPIWRSSVRKILLSNARFNRNQFNPNIFGIDEDN